jgi:D-erythro-7,8-dihydroneopterin triphosphate epimerase
MIVRIHELRLRAFIGIEEWEQRHRQDLVVNTEIEFDAAAASHSDAIADTVNYKTLTKRMIEHVENGRFALLERLAAELLGIATSDPRVRRAAVRVEKPHALRYADSVSVEARSGDGGG